MGVSWDWLRPLITAPYIPALGPVHPPSGVAPGPPEYRGYGLGRLLWRTAMQWGQRHQAAYQLLQTQVGGASDRMCQLEGLADLGLVCTTTL